MENHDNYNQPVDSVPARVRAVVRDVHTHSNVIHWVPLDEPSLNPADFE